MAASSTVPPDRKNPHESTATATEGPAKHNANVKTPATGAGLTAEDIAEELLSDGRNDDTSRVADLPTLKSIKVQVYGYRTALGLPNWQKTSANQVVAVSTGTDLEKDEALMAFLREHPEIDTVHVEVFTNLGRMTLALSAADLAAEPLGLNLLQVVTDFDDEFQRLAAKASDLVALPPETLLLPNLTVGRARLLLSEFIRTLDAQQATVDNRTANVGRKQNAADNKVVAVQTTFAQQASVNRLKKAAQAGLALPAPAPASGKSGSKAGQTTATQPATKTARATAATAARTSSKKKTAARTQATTAGPVQQARARRAIRRSTPE